MSTSIYEKNIDYSKGSFSSFIPTDINQGWVIDPAILVKNLDYIATTLSMSSEDLENKFYDLITKVFSDVNYLQALQTEYFKLPSGTVTLANIDTYVESLYQAIILYAVIDTFTNSSVSNASEEAEKAILDVLNLVIASGFQTTLNTTISTIDLSGLSNLTIDNYVDTIYNSIGATTIPRKTKFELTATDIAIPTIAQLYLHSGVISYFDPLNAINVDTPSDLAKIKVTITFDQNISGLYNPSDWSFINGETEIVNSGFTIYSDVAGNNTTAPIQILPGTQISFRKSIPGSGLFIVDSNRTKTHPPISLLCTFTDDTYKDDATLDTSGKILGKRSGKIAIFYKDPINSFDSSASRYDKTEHIINIDTLAWPFDQVISIPFAKDCNPTLAPVRLADTLNPMNSVSTNLTDIGTIKLSSDKFGLDFIPNVGVDLVRDLPGKYFSYNWTEVTPTGYNSGQDIYRFVSRLVPKLNLPVLFEPKSTTPIMAFKIEPYTVEDTFTRISDKFTFNDASGEYDMDYTFAIDKANTDPSWSLTFINGVYTFDGNYATITIRRRLDISNSYEMYTIFKGTTIPTSTELASKKLVMTITAIDTKKYTTDSVLDNSNQPYGKRVIKYEVMYTNTNFNYFSIIPEVKISLDRAFTGFTLSNGVGNTAIQYISSRYIIDPSKKDDISITTTLISTTLPAKQVVQIADNKVYFQSLDTSLDVSTLDALTLDYFNNGLLSELGAIYAGKEVKIRIQINNKSDNSSILDGIQTIKFVAHSVTW